MENPVEKPAETPKTTHTLREERILKFWQENDTFAKTLAKPSSKGEYIFYDGPPFASGTPHYGHMLAGTIKDIIPRYKTMQGYHVPRRWGWDCHGLPLENIIEKELGLKTKRDIEALGIETFNEAARTAVMRYAHVWREEVPRFGRWVDMEHDYRTMDTSYTQSVWWAFATLHKKGLIYEGHKAMHMCPRCGTTLSNFEVAQGYKDITDISVYVSFPLEDDPATSLVAWTTTPWTLPGNVALAVKADIEYSRIALAADNSKKYIIATSRLGTVKGEYTVIDTLKGAALVGKKYTPPFDYYTHASHLKHREHAWQVYAADFVTTDSGTGIVHIAPGFGADDYALARRHELPIIQHVGMDGAFVPVVKAFAGMQAKPAATTEMPDNHQSGDVAVLKALATAGRLFAKEKITHSYPHCWRCDTPLLNYAASSWFVKVSAFKDQLVKANGAIHWVPEEIGKNRFGNLLASAPDWAISRSRYWGAPIPVWRSADHKESLVIHSVEDIRRETKARQPETLATLVLMRHGETGSNVANVVSASEKKADGLTVRGQEQVRAAAASLKAWVAKNGAFDAIVVSPFPRTQETAKIVSEGLGGVPIHNDVRLIEVQASAYDGKSWKEYLSHYKDRREQFTKKLEGVETLAAVRERVGAALYEIHTTYAGKRVLIISHSTPLCIMSALASGHDTDEKMPAFNNAEWRTLDFVPLPHNPRFELDFHRPYIDEIQFKATHGGVLKRVPDVFDCWFESGSMPFASVGYDGMPLPGFNPQGALGGLLGKMGLDIGRQGFPADFIAEGLDQTRGWFYSMLVLGVALFGESPYKHVVVNGLVLAEDGKKMSKKLKNYPDPRIMVEKYGADAIRYFLVASSAVVGEEVRFSEKNVDEVVKKIINRLDNVVQFYEVYKGVLPTGVVGAHAHAHTRATNVLDIWLQARFKETAIAVTKGLDVYELHTAARPIADFIDDLSVWYIRRSRDRFKAEPAAVEFLRHILTDVAVLIAPFMPFLAEDIFGRMASGGESVHMQPWVRVEGLTSTEKQSLELMRETRKVVTEALDARTKAGVKVRQPLALLTVRSEALLGRADYIALIQDEVNVKEVKIAPAASEVVVLDTVLTPELIDEGRMRQFTRALQEVRKGAGLAMNDAATLVVEPLSADAEAFLSRFHAQIEKATRTTLKVVSYKEKRGEEGGVKGEEVEGTIDIDGLGYTVIVG